MILIDTCTLIWLTSEHKKLSPKSKEVIKIHHGKLFVSSISAFEIGVKASKGKLTLPIPIDRWFNEALEYHGIREIPINSAIAIQATALPPLHRDPCDRIIIATALLHDCPILTPDQMISQYKNVRAEW